MKHAALRLLATSGYQSKPSSEAQVRLPRLCLSCKLKFDSAWAGERVCPRCKATTAWRNGASVSDSGRAASRAGRKGSS
jgi:uncharacterized paraquat-inducible protein A